MYQITINDKIIAVVVPADKYLDLEMECFQEILEDDECKWEINSVGNFQVVSAEVEDNRDVLCFINRWKPGVSSRSLSAVKSAVYRFRRAIKPGVWAVFDQLADADKGTSVEEAVRKRYGRKKKAAKPTA